MVSHCVEKEVSRGKRLWFLAVLSPAIRSRIMYVLVCLCVCVFVYVRASAFVFLCGGCVHTQGLGLEVPELCVGRVCTQLSERDNVCLRSVCTCAPACLFAPPSFSPQTNSHHTALASVGLYVDQDGFNVAIYMLLLP